MLRLRDSLVCGLASIGLHVGLMSTLSDSPRAGSKPPPAQIWAEFTVTDSALSTARSETESVRLEVVPGGARSRHSLDREGRPGAGGDGQTLQAVVLLLPEATPVTLLDTWLNNPQVNQTQRLRTDRRRTTPETRRATPQPAEDVFAATGPGRVRERRPRAADEPAAGAPNRVQIASKALPQLPESAEGLRSANPQPETIAAGVHRGRGLKQHKSAASQLARPAVDSGPLATQAHARDRRVRDNVDAELLSARLSRSWVESSVAAAHERGAGRGGVRALGRPQLGSGAAAGSRAHPHLPGLGSAGALDTRDSRYMFWFARQRQRIADRLVFPSERALAKDQGTSLYRIVVRRDGRVTGPPSLVRSSGHHDFDQEARRAIQSTPFSPLPAALAPDLDEVAILLPIEFSNPMVQ